MEYSLSNHAKERYAERIMNRDNITDIRKYISDHDEDIEERVNKLIEFGKMIYTGPLGNKNYVEVYIKDLWVILVGPTKKVVITLYKIDFGDDEFNDFFVKRMTAKIDDVHKAIDISSKEAEDDIEAYQDIIRTNNDEISFLKKQIANLEEMNEGYRILIKNASTDKENKERELRRLVEQLILKKEF